MSSGAGADDTLDLDARVSEILGGPLDQFIAARDGLARALKHAGRREDATGVTALRKPGVHLWVANQLARQHPVAVRRLAATAADLADAQAEVLSGGSGAGDRLRRDATEYQRALDQALREARAVLQAVSRGMTEETLRRVREVLANAAAGSPESRDLLVAGNLREEPETPGFGMFAAGANPAPPRRTAARPNAAPPGADAARRAESRAEERAHRAAEDAAQEQEKTRRVTLQRDLDHAEADARRAEQSARRLRRRAEATAAEARAADEQAGAAEEALVRARAAAEEARTRLD